MSRLVLRRFPHPRAGVRPRRIAERRSRPRRCCPACARPEPPKHTKFPRGWRKITRLTRDYYDRRPTPADRRGRRKLVILLRRIVRFHSDKQQMQRLIDDLKAWQKLQADPVAYRAYLEQIEKEVGLDPVPDPWY